MKIFLHPTLQALLILLATGSNVTMAGIAPSLGIANSFAVLGGATVTNIGSTTIYGDMGVSPGTITGTAANVTGTIHAADGIAASAQTDTVTAYNNLAGQACDFGPTGATDLAGATLPPGVYCYSSTLQNSGLLTLDAAGNSNAVWIFQIGSTLTTSSASSIQVINNGQNSNVFWQVGSSATLGTTSKLSGNVLALTSITLNTGASVSGRILAQTGTVTLDSNTVALAPVLNISKSVSVISDPLDGISSPKAIPGAEMLYLLTVINSGYGIVDSNTTVVTDPIPLYMMLCVSALCSNPPIGFSCSTLPACGLTYSYIANVSYSNQIGGGPPYTYAAIPDAAGYDTNVTGIRINPGNIFNGISSGSNPLFTLSLKMKVK